MTDYWQPIRPRRRAGSDPERLVNADANGIQFCLKFVNVNMTVPYLTWSRY